jgi:phosphonate transport system substrate-binding protein
MRAGKWVALALVLGLVAAACGDDDATTTTAASTVGTEDNPIQVLYVPSVSAEEIIAGGELLADALNEATGLFFEVSVPTSYAATVEAMCASPDDTMGFIPAQAYVLANNLCGVSIDLKASRFGYTEYWTQFVVQRDSDIQSFEDLAGRTWGYTDPGSTSGYLIPQGMFLDSGVEPGEATETGGHPNAVRAVYNGEVDFGTSFFSPNIDADGNTVWDGTPEDADVPDDLVDTCALDAEGELECSGLYPRDARRNLREELPDIIQKVRILTLSDPIPNDGVAFGPTFSAALRAQIVDAIKAFAADDPDGFATAFDAYSWTSVADTEDSEFDSIRAILTAIGFDLEDL